MTTRRLLLALALGLAACGGDDGPPADATDVTDAALTPDAATDAGADTADTADTHDVDAPEPAGPPGRAVHRMTIEQLARSVPVITGGIAWTEDFGEGPQDMLQVLAPTLGAPDYVRITEESLEPSLVVAKFMQDAGRRVCAKWVQRDRERPAAERTLTVHDDWASLDEGDVKRSLRGLQLRFFSRHVPPDDDAPIADLYQLFVAASSAAPPGKEADDGWLAVCMALMTDPEMILY